MARELAKEGCKIILIARSEQELEIAKDELPGKGADVDIIPCDLTNPAHLAEMLKAAMAIHGRIDIIVNDAGRIDVAPVDSLEEGDFRAAMDLMFWGPARIVLGLLLSLLQSGDADIVNISSIGGKVAVPHLLPYCSAKFALCGFSEGLDAEVRARGVRVLTCYAGPVANWVTQESLVWRRHRRGIPLVHPGSDGSRNLNGGRTRGTPDRICAEGAQEDLDVELERASGTSYVWRTSRVVHASHGLHECFSTIGQSQSNQAAWRRTRQTAARYFPVDHKRGRVRCSDAEREFAIVLIAHSLSTRCIVVAHRTDGHSNAKTTGLYDRHNHDMSVSEVDRGGI